MIQSLKQLEIFQSEDRKEVPLPKNCTLKEWSRTVCQLPKVNGEPKWNGKTYSELLRLAIDGDHELDKFWDSFSRSIMDPMMELTSLRPWIWLAIFSIWNFILRGSHLVHGRELSSRDLIVTPVIDTLALRF